MNQENLALLELAAKQLGEFRQEVSFVGGATVELWITDPAAPEFRPTGDIDVVVEIATIAEFHRLEKRLRTLGFENDQASGMICRFKLPNTPLLLDVMPTEATEILGFDNRWQKDALPHTSEITLASGLAIRVIPPPYLLATKLEAFATRGKGDFYGSRDFGDIVVLIDGRHELPAEMASAPADLRAYVAKRFESLMGSATFESGVEGALAPGPETQERADLVVKPRIEAIVSAAKQDSALPHR